MMTTTLDPSSTVAWFFEQIASFSIENRLRQSAIFVSVKVAKQKGGFFIYFHSLLYKTNRFHVAVRLTERASCAVKR